MKKTSLLFFFTFLTIVNNSAGQNPSNKKGTITVKKTGHLTKVVFDDVNYRLLGVDMYGNVMDTAVMEFKMFVTIKGVFYKTATVGPNLNKEMQELLERRDSRTTIFFKNIKAKDRNGTILNMPDFGYTFPYSRDYE